MVFTVAGRALIKAFAEKGRYRRTMTAPTFFASFNQVQWFRRRFGARTHDNNDPVRIRRTDIIEQMILTADDGEFIHGFLDNIRQAS